MTYWDRIVCSARYFSNKQNHRIHRDRLGDPNSINKIEVHYCSGVEEIFGSNECYDFLSTHSSFEEAQNSLKISGIRDNISCVNIIDKTNIEYYKIEHPSMVYDMGTIEVFYNDGPSMLEKEIENLEKNL